MDLEKNLDPMPAQSLVTQQAPAPAQDPAPNAVPVPPLRVLPVPLPEGTDPTFTLPVTVSGQVGLCLVACPRNMVRVPNATVLEKVDDASRPIDDLIPGPALLVHRAYFASQLPLNPRMAIHNYKLPVDTPFTVAHLLTLMVRKQYDGWHKNFKQMAAMIDVELIAGGGETGAPQGFASYEHLYLVAIRRSDGKDGRVRWYPELEVRF